MAHFTLTVIKLEGTNFGGFGGFQSSAKLNPRQNKHS